MKTITPELLLNLIKGQNFKTEKDMSLFFKRYLPPFFGINDARVIAELRTTGHDSTLSNLTDLVILDNINRDQVLVTFEFKLHKSIVNFQRNQYENAEKQLHKYCQDLKSPYGILLSEKICKIYHYTFRGSVFHFDEILALPRLIEIEKELEHPTEKKTKSLLFLLPIILIALSILGYYYFIRNEITCGPNQIKGNVSLYSNGKIKDKIYHVPDGKFYNITKTYLKEGDRCFSTAKAAEKAGFRASEL